MKQDNNINDVVVTIYQKN